MQITFPSLDNAKLPTYLNCSASNYLRMNHSILSETRRDRLVASDRASNSNLHHRVNWKIPFIFDKIPNLESMTPNVNNLQIGKILHLLCTLFVDMCLTDPKNFSHVALQGVRWKSSTAVFLLNHTTFLHSRVCSVSFDLTAYNLFALKEIFFIQKISSCVPFENFMSEWQVIWNFSCQCMVPPMPSHPCMAWAPD